MDQHLEKFIRNIQQNIKQIHLSAMEKGEVHDALLLEIQKSAEPAFFTQKRLSWAFASVLLLGSLGGVAFAAEGTLPGNALYPIKTKVEEPILRVLHSTTPENKANFEADILAERLVEAEKLDAKNKLTDGRETQVTEGLAEQGKRVESAVNVLIAVPNVTDDNSQKQNQNKKQQETAAEQVTSAVASSSVSSDISNQLHSENQDMHVIDHIERVIEDHQSIINKIDK